MKAQHETMRMQMTAESTRGALSIVNEAMDQLAEENQEFYSEETEEYGGEEYTSYKPIGELLTMLDDEKALTMTSAYQLPVLVRATSGGGGDTGGEVNNGPPPPPTPPATTISSQKGNVIPA